MKSVDQDFLENIYVNITSEYTLEGKYFPLKSFDQPFFYHSAFKSHVQTHTCEKLFSCEVCGTRFSTSFNLKIHMRTHTDEKLFPCEVCGSAFSRNSDLKVHM